MEPKLVKSTFFASACVAFALFAGTRSFAQSAQDLQAKWTLLKKQPGYQLKNETVDLLNKLSLASVYNMPDSGLYYANLALAMAQQQKYPAGKVRALNNFGRADYIKGNYDSALIVSDSALELGEKTNDSLPLSSALINIGLIYMEQGGYSEAIRRFTRSLDIVTALRDSVQMAKIYFNIGSCSDEQGDYDKAASILGKAIAVDPATGDHHITAMAYNRLGKIAYHAKNYTKALDYYKMVLGYKPYQDNWEASFAYQGLAETFYALKQYPIATTYAQKGFKAARDMNAKWDAEQALDILAKSQAATGDFAGAYSSRMLDQVYRDSLNSEAKQQAEGFFKLQTKEAANETLKKENLLIHDKVRLTVILSVIAGIFCVTLILGIIMFYRGYRAKLKLSNELIKKNESISNLNQMKDQLFSVVSHDLRGPMASLQQTLELVNENALTEAQQKILLQSLGQQVTVSNQMLTNLLAWAATQRKGMAANITRVEPGAVLHDMLAVFNTLAGKKNVRIAFDTSTARPLMADENQFKIIVQNLLSNAIKFTPKNGAINIYFTNGDGRVALHISDTGIGMGEEKRRQLFKNFGTGITSSGTDKEKGTGIGLMLVKEFADQNNATLGVTSQPGKGTTFSVLFPAA